MKNESRQKASASKPTAAEPRDPARTIENWYALGVLIKKLRAKRPYEVEELLKELKELNDKKRCLLPQDFNKTHLLKVECIQAAFTADQIEWIGKLTRKHNNARFGTAHLFSLLPLKSEENFLGIIEEAIENKWSTRAADIRVRSRPQTRKSGAGRKPHVPQGTGSTRTQLASLTTKWLNYSDGAKNTFSNELLPLVHSADRALRKIQRALRKSHPG